MKKIGTRVKAKRKLPAPAGGWGLGAPHYNPEVGSRPEDLEVRTTDYVKRFAAREAYGAQTPDCDAVLMAPEYDRTAGQFQWSPRRITSLAQLKEFSSSSLGQRKRAIETMGDPFAADTDVLAVQNNAYANIDQEFVPLMSGPYHKQLYIYDYLLMHARAFEMANHAALASAAIKILTRFTVGRGLTFHVKDEKCQEIWDEFWDRNRLKSQSRQMARDLPWQGELMLRYQESKPGYLSTRIVDPSTCWEIVTDPENIDHVYYYHFQWPAPYQLYTTGQIPISRYVVQQVPPTNIQHTRINMSSQEKRGRSDLLPVMPWIKRFNDFFNGQTIKAVLEANLVYKIKIMGDQTNIDDIMNDPKFAQLPPPGGIFFENEAMTLEPISASMTASRGSSGIGEQLAAIVAAALNMPPEYLNIGGSSGARGGGAALVRTDPIVKAVEERQQIMTEIFEEMYDRVIASAIDAGRLNAKSARIDPEIRRGPADQGRARNGRPSPQRQLLAKEIA